MARVNIIRRVNTEAGWTNVALERDPKGRIKWNSGVAIEWRQNGKRLREAAGVNTC